MESKQSDSLVCWNGNGLCPQNESNHVEMSICAWKDEVTLNQEDLSYMLEETTPVKAFGDFAYNVSSCDSEIEKSRWTCSQSKRRRMLQFDTQVDDLFICSEENSSTLFNSNENSFDSFEDVIPDGSQWISGVSEHASASSGFLDQSSEQWIAECFNDLEFSPNEMNFSGAADVQIDVSEFCDMPLESETPVVRAPRKIVFKGKKSFISTPTKLPSTVVYPFAIIKPCSAHGDVTLKDINKRIHSPPSPKPKIEEPIVYQTSAFSGKPVVGKTKIHTKGGKGSITIMRTKG